METIEHYREMLKKRLSEKRYRHSVGVEKEAVKLAKLYGCDVVKAQYAGLLHDITKEENYENQLKMAKKYGIVLESLEKACIKIIHEITGAGYVKNELGIEDADILGGIRYHSTGHSGMTQFEKIIFVADLSEENRKFADVEEFRKIAYTDLDQAVLYVLNITLKKMLETNGLIHLDTVEARNDFFMADRKNTDEI